MNKTAVKNFAVWARGRLIADVRYRAGLVGITERGIQDPLPQSDATAEFYDIGTATPYVVSGPAAIRQRRSLAESAASPRTAATIPPTDTSWRRRRTPGLTASSPCGSWR